MTFRSRGTVESPRWPLLVALLATVAGGFSVALSAAELVPQARADEVRWVELTPLVGSRQPLLVMITGTEEVVLEPAVPPGPTMMCTGGESSAVFCRTVEIGGSAPAVEESTEPLAVGFDVGSRVSGRVVSSGEATVGARVAIVPHGLRISFPFTMPLELEDSSSVGLRRELFTDTDGGFISPALVAGEYFLEILLPGARVYRSQTFEIPANIESANGDPNATVDLGQMEIEPGLAIEIEVVDLAGNAIAGADITAHQGQNPADVSTYQGQTDMRGRVLISGTDPGLPLVVRCRAAGYLDDRAELEVAEAYHQFRMEQIATVVAEVVDVDGEPLVGAAASARLRSAAGEVSSFESDADESGRLSLELPASDEGSLRVAAPGHEVREVAFRSIAGSVSDLGRLTLLAGRGISGTVVDGATHQPLAGVQIRAVAPRGALAVSSGADGRFVANVDVRFAVELAFELGSHVRRVVPFSPAQLREGDLGEIVLELGGWVLAAVSDESGAVPCHGCPIQIEPGGQRLLTDARGEAISEPLRPGSYRVYRPRITHLGSTVVVDEDAEAVFAKVEAGRVSKVRLGPRSRTIELVFDPPLPASWTLSSRSPWRIERYFARSGGSFAVGQKKNEQIEIFGHFYESGGYETAIRLGSLPAGEKDERIVLRPPKGGIDGELESMSDGGPLAGAEVSILSLDDNSLVASSRTDERGRFAIPCLAAGAYVVYVGDRPLRFVVVGELEGVHLGTHQLSPGGY